MEKISIVRCSNYDNVKVREAIYQCLDQLEGIKTKIKPNSKVLVKTNLLKKNKPDDAVTTHPAVVEGIVAYLQNMGCEVIIGDSPGGPFTERFLKGIYQATGMADVSERTGCRLNYDTTVVDVTNPEAVKLKNMQVIKAIKDVDFVVSAAKLKTHGMMTYTGAVKNLFGVIPGLTKVDYHFKMNDTRNFAEHLLDICQYVKPVFSVIDAIEGMEGDGPSAGDKRQVGLLMASENPHALDYTAVGIMGINHKHVPTIAAAKERMLFSGEENDLEIVGVQLDEIKIKPFKLPKSANPNMLGSAPKFLQKYVLDNLRPKPVFNHGTCISCGDCKRACPAKAIEMVEKKPQVDLQKCIRCFCCHELCPEKAVDIKRNRLYHMVFRS